MGGIVSAVIGVPAIPTAAASCRRRASAQAHPLLNDVSARRSAGKRIHKAIKAIKGLNRSGTKIVFDTEAHKIPCHPKAIAPAPHRAPTMACVVETGKPVFVANSTQPMEPMRTAIKKRLEI